MNKVTNPAIEITGKPIINEADIQIDGYRELHQSHFPTEEGIEDTQLIPIIHAVKSTKNEVIIQNHNEPVST